jgi:hypothetical protein
VIVEELQLVGYTADLQNLVFSDDRGTTRFKAALDDDLLATLEEVLHLRDPEGPRLQPAPAPEPETTTEPRMPAPDPEPGREAAAPDLATFDVPGREETAEESADPAPADPAPAPLPAARRLSPREIQVLLRAGRSTKAVAREAGTDEAWVLRWLPPIEAERRQVLAAVHRGRVEKARLGPSHDLLGEAVRRNLLAKGVGPEDDTVRWTASRGEGDRRWKVTLAYRNRGRQHRAIWRFDVETNALEPRNKLATELAWTRAPGPADTAAAAGATPERTRSAPRAAAKKGGQAARRSGKKAAAKKAGRQQAGKKAAGKKAVGKKASGRKPAARKTAARRPTGAGETSPTPAPAAAPPPDPTPGPALPPPPPPAVLPPPPAPVGQPEAPDDTPQEP